MTGFLIVLGVLIVWCSIMRAASKPSWGDVGRPPTLFQIRARAAVEAFRKMGEAFTALGASIAASPAVKTMIEFHKAVNEVAAVTGKTTDEAGEWLRADLAGDPRPFNVAIRDATRRATRGAIASSRAQEDRYRVGTREDVK